MPLSITSSLRMDATSATFFGLPELVQQRLDLGDASGRANTGDKLLTLVATVLTTPMCCALAGRPALSAA